MGRVDCTKYSSVCEQYEVRSYPTILFLNRGLRERYRGDRSASSLIDFAIRLNGPLVRTIEHCDDLEESINRLGLIVLSTSRKKSDKLYETFESVAKSLRSVYWFYHSSAKCRGLQADKIYLMKAHVAKALQFDSKQDSENLERKISEWVARESFPINGEINSLNFDKTIAMGKTIVLAVLNEYKPAKNFLPTSKIVFSLFDKYAKKNNRHDDQLNFGWSSDLDLIESIVIGSLPVPNLMIIRPDLSYIMLFKDEKKKERELKNSKKFSEPVIKSFIDGAKSGKLPFEGGSTYYHRILRFFHGIYNSLSKSFYANPLLATVLVLVPSSILLIVIYTTCIHDSSNWSEPSGANYHKSDNPDESNEEDNDCDDTETKHQGNQGTRSSHRKQE